MEFEEYPQQVTEDEAELGFRLRIFAGFGERRRFPDGKLIQPPVVAALLSSSEILVKIFGYAPDGTIAYTHQQYGVTAWSGGESEWSPRSGPHKDAALFIQEHKSGTFELHELAPSIVARSFRYEDAG
jgi:hypothetical protein